MTKLFTIVNQTIACLMSKKLATFNLKTIKTKNNGGTPMRKREKKGSLLHQAEVRLTEMMVPGRSKHEDKKINVTGDKIYSYKTFKNYMNKSAIFIRWIKENHPECCDLDECKKYVVEYINSLTHYSNASKMTVRSALKKLYQEEFDVKIGCCRRADITRSRKPAARDKRFDEKKNWELVDFCRGTGLRNNKELQVLRGNMLEKFGDEYWLVGVKGKGGKMRNVRVLPEYADTVVRLCLQAGENRVWPYVHSAADVHSYRADYAHLWYNKLARPIEEVPRRERYYCRMDKRGTIYDRKALLTVSRYLGHNRIQVMAHNYMWKSEEEMSKICPMKSVGSL